VSMAIKYLWGMQANPVLIRFGSLLGKRAKVIFKGRQPLTDSTLTPELQSWNVA
jgi:hypothetical protein